MQRFRTYPHLLTWKLDMMCMKKRLRYSAFALLAAALLSCSKAESIGEPYMLFEIHGIVMDQDGNAIEGIQVSGGNSDVVKTNVNGRFSYHGRSVPMTVARLTFEDKDGDNNGGEFQKLTVDVEMNLKIKGEEYGNFKGKYFAQDVEIRLFPKNATISPDPEL